MTRRALLLASLAISLATTARRAHAERIVLPGVSLLDQSGTPRSLAGIARGRPVVLSFFFTGCTTICPPQTSAMQVLQEELRGTAGARPLLLSITLDPLGDTPEAMRAYAGRFGLLLGPEHDWFLLGGDPQALQRVWTSFGQPGARPEEHAAQIWLGAPDGRTWRRVGALTPPGQVASMLREMAP
ncbi:SCO family protein (plasmid) [Roseomonas gilardii subsp. gilardii]|uniref:SCO family protein n=1 Tax=Roseomonas gilardii TaxID=257708 RepID=UPI001FF771B0|nr:SCO family protein [Roseomonas gilardii]UPG74578.1 SCO family protein [Roseomonas gilardii subsp. gilardii]